jgi:hypothetical protein
MVRSNAKPLGWSVVVRWFVGGCSQNSLTRVNDGSIGELPQVNEGTSHSRSEALFRSHCWTTSGETRYGHTVERDALANPTPIRGRDCAEH